MDKQKALKIVVDWCLAHGDSTAQEAAGDLAGAKIDDCSACKKVLPEEKSVVAEIVKNADVVADKPKRSKK